MFDYIWKRVDGLFASIDRLFARAEAEEFRQAEYREPGAPLSKRKHRIVSTAGHIVIDGDFKSITINGRLIRLVEKKK